MTLSLSERGFPYGSGLSKKKRRLRDTGGGVSTMDRGLHYKGLWTPNSTSYPNESLVDTDSGNFWICDSDGIDKDGRQWYQDEWIAYNGKDATSATGWDNLGRSAEYEIEYYTDSSYLPAVGTTEIVYITEDNNRGYLWDGTKYVPLFSDVKAYATKANFPATGQADRIYIDKDQQAAWYWDGSVYILISGATGSMSSAPYRFSSAITGSPPNGRVRLNNTDPALATEIYISEEDKDGINRAYGISSLKAGDYISLIDNNSDKFQDRKSVV